MDFAACFKDWASETTNFPNFVVEQAMAHAIPSAVEAGLSARRSVGQTPAAGRGVVEILHIAATRRGGGGADARCTMTCAARGPPNSHAARACGCAHRSLREVLRKTPERLEDAGIRHDETGDRWTDAIVAAGNTSTLNRWPITSTTLPPGGSPRSCRSSWATWPLILRLLHARGRKRKRGKPNGTLWRWTDPNYLAAWFVEQRIAARKHEIGRRSIPNSERAEIIARTVDEARTWHCARRKKPSIDRVTAILKGPRSRRLPG